MPKTKTTEVEPEFVGPLSPEQYDAHMWWVTLFSIVPESKPGKGDGFVEYRHEPFVDADAAADYVKDLRTWAGRGAGIPDDQKDETWVAVLTKRNKRVRNRFAVQENKFQLVSGPAGVATSLHRTIAKDGALEEFLFGIKSEEAEVEKPKAKVGKKGKRPAAKVKVADAPHPQPRKAKVKPSGALAKVRARKAALNAA